MHKRIVQTNLFILIICYTVFLAACSNSQGDAVEMNKANLFSETLGVLTLDGAPLENAELIRTVRWRDENHQDTTTTDSSGKFRFPEIHSDSSMSILPSEFNAFQKIIIRHNNEEFLLWETVKADPVSNGELEGEALNFNCELNDDLRFVHLLLNSIETRCTW